VLGLPSIERGIPPFGGYLEQAFQRPFSENRAASKIGRVAGSFTDTTEQHRIFRDE
jgi:hypothetical protein